MTVEAFGKYEVIAKLGEGGFGVVYRGRDPDLKRTVAIKTSRSPSEELRKRFEREAESAARLQHPNIVSTYDFGYQDEIPYLVQEYLPGEDLDRKIRRQEPLDTATKLDYLRQVALGLRHAHSKDVVHRDIKPANLRVLEDGRVKIMDFGIAKLMNAEVDLTQTGITMGTACYLAPEQFRGEKVDLRADIFSFGVTAYELLTYRRPFEGDSVATLFYQINHRQPEPVATRWPGCPPALARCIERCLEKDREQRFPDLAPVIAELDELLSSSGGAPSGTYSSPAPPPVPPAASGSAIASGEARPVTAPTRLALGTEEPDSGFLSRAYDSAFRLQRWRPLRLAAIVLLAAGIFALGAFWRSRPGPPGGPEQARPESAAASRPAPPTRPSAAAQAEEEEVVAEEEGVVAEEDAAPRASLEVAGTSGEERPATARPSPPPTTPPPSRPTPSRQVPKVTPPPAAAVEPQVTVEPPATGAEPAPQPVDPATGGASRGTTGAEPAGAQAPSGPGLEIGAVLFEHGQFQGMDEAFYGDDPDLIDNRIGHNEASSVRVDAGCEILLYRKPNYRGAMTRLTADTPSLRETKVGNDKVSSLKIYCRR